MYCGLKYKRDGRDEASDLSLACQTSCTLEVIRDLKLDFERGTSNSSNG